MELNEAKEMVEFFLNSGNKLVFNDKEVELLNGCFHMMMYHVYLLENDTMVKGLIDVKLAKDAIRMISTKVLNEGISDGLYAFVKAFCNLLYNWNNNVLEDKDIELLCIFSGKIVDLRNDMLNTIDVMKDVYGHYMDLRGWMPPAFDISKAYLEKLLEGK
jgi:hypothetical protein